MDINISGIKPVKLTDAQIKQTLEAQEKIDQEQAAQIKHLLEQGKKASVDQVSIDQAKEINELAAKIKAIQAKYNSLIKNEKNPEIRLDLVDEEQREELNLTALSEQGMDSKYTGKQLSKLLGKV